MQSNHPIHQEGGSQGPPSDHIKESYKVPLPAEFETPWQTRGDLPLRPRCGFEGIAKRLMGGNSGNRRPPDSQAVPARPWHAHAPVTQSAQQCVLAWRHAGPRRHAIQPVHRQFILQLQFRRWLVCQHKAHYHGRLAHGGQQGLDPSGRRRLRTRVIKIGGKLPVNFQIGAYYNALRPQFGSTWQLRTQVNLDLLIAKYEKRRAGMSNYNE